AVLQLSKLGSAPGAPKSAWLDLARLLIARKMALRQVRGDWKDVEDALLKSPLETPEPYLREARALVLRGKIDEAERRWVDVREVQVDLAVEVRDWPAVDASLKEIQRIGGAGGPMGNYAQALKLMRQAEGQGQPAPQEARELLERVAAARPKWTAVQLARAE